MKKLTLQNLFGFPLVIEENDCATLIKMPIDGSVKKSYLCKAPQGGYWDLGELFTEVKINIFNDGSYNLTFRGEANNCRKDLKKSRILFYNALHKILGQDSNGERNFTFDDFVKLQSGGQWIYAKCWDDDRTTLDYLGIELGIQFTIYSSNINKYINKEIDLTPDLYLVPKQTHQPPHNKINANKKEGKAKGCFKFFLIILLVLFLFSAMVSAIQTM